jgi:hypothetical protein
MRLLLCRWFSSKCRQSGVCEQSRQYDDDFDAGKLAEDEYVPRRRELKERLVKALRVAKGSE